MSIKHWINDALMAIFLLMIGLELEQEPYNGKLHERQAAQRRILPAPSSNDITCSAVTHLTQPGRPRQLAARAAAAYLRRTGCSSSSVLMSFSSTCWCRKEVE